MSLTNKILFILPLPQVPKWVIILMNELSKNDAYYIYIRPNPTNQSYRNPLIAFEQKTSKFLRTDWFEIKDVRHLNIIKSYNDDEYTIINLSIEHVKNAYCILINDSPFAVNYFHSALYIKQGIPFNVSLYKNNAILNTYLTSNTSAFMTSRMKNVIGALTDCIYYHFKNNKSLSKLFDTNTKVTFLTKCYFLIQYFISIIKLRIETLTKHSAVWHIALRENNNHKLQIFKMPKGEFWADPFFASPDSTQTVFFERMKRDTNKGEIWQLDTKTKVIQPLENFITDSHVSFPFVTHQSNQVHMIPEHKESNKIEALVVAGLKVTAKHLLLDNIKAVDALVHHANNYYWLICTVQATPLSSSGDALHIFYAKNFNGPWNPHQLNPIKLGNNSSRNAGAIFERNGYLIRPAQNGSIQYGGSIKLMKIKELSINNYVEEMETEIFPSEFHPKAQAIHTLNYCNDNILIDILLKTNHANA